VPPYAPREPAPEGASRPSTGMAVTFSSRGQTLERECDVSTPELVTLRIDEREVQVPKGTGLVETAMAAGIEIPVFCYEPRLGPAVGACRMCLVEVEGMPKLQAGCTMSAQDGMVVKTAQTSERAAQGQNATLEFILVNHPLDCPVCDKGGECPLQDLTFRWGPGSTRMTFPKRTFEKPIPISPTISLDRERCILCYRCTRFSEGVAEDGQLVAVARGAQSLITTFQDEPYRAPFSGNVTELCPVGALLPTQYRFLARPWEIQNVPTVCQLCPVGCNVQATTREGKVKRILSRNHPEVDEGWLCDKGRFAFSHLYAPDRIVEPLRRRRRRGFDPIGWDEALDEAERLLRAAEGRIVTALSGSETVEQAYALARLLRAGLDSHSAVLPEETDDSVGAFRLPLSAIREAELVVVVGDDPVVERAPLVDLWLRAARRRGAEVVTIGPTGTVHAQPGAAAEVCAGLCAEGNELGDRLRAAERAIVIWSGPEGNGGAEVAALAQKLGFEGKLGCGAFHLPATPNGRGVAEAWAAASEGEGPTPTPIGLLVVSGDEAAADPNVRALAERAESVLALTMFQGVAVGWADLVLPATSYLEREGTTVNLEGRLQRLRRAAIPPGPDELAWISKLAARFGVTVSPYPARVFEELSRTLYGGLAYSEVGELAPLRGRSEVSPPRPHDAPEPVRASEGHFLNLLRYRPLFSGPAVERVPELQFQRPAGEIELSADDAQRRRIRSGDEVEVRSNGTAIALRAMVRRDLVRGVVRIAEEDARDLHATVEVTASPNRRDSEGAPAA
jgi:NADH-quinone oxidoreductase subunit G